MSLVIINSPDLTLLSVRVTWDISGTNPVIELENLSQGAHLENVDWAFVAKSPTGTFIHEGDINTPDITGTWTSHTLTDAWPRPFNSIEWSGAPYSFYVIAKDSNGNIYQTSPQEAAICRPKGNLPTSKNFYGTGSVIVQVKCEDAGIFFQDATNTSYKGLTGEIGSSVLKVTFPMDDTGTQSAPFQISSFSTALVPISFSAPGYQFYYSSTYDYDFGNEVHVIIRYVEIETFPVYCNIDLCPLVCEIAKLVQSIETGNCADAESANSKLLLINSKLNLVMIGIKEPLCGIDVPKLIQEIETIGGFDCNCCNVPTGIVRQSSSVIGGYNFIINPICGDIDGTVSTNGNNITFNLQDKSYVFRICQNSPPTTTAFTVIPSTEGCQKTYCLNIDGIQLSEDILNNILTDSGLVNLFNTIVQQGSGDFDLIVDGKCIFSSSATCDYSFFLTGIPADTTFALLTSIKVSGINHAINFAFNLTNLPALQVYLNGLGYGTFSVSASEGGVLITSNTNPNDIQALVYKVSATTYLADLNKNCTGFVAKSANEVVQAIIDYLCTLDDSEIITSESYTICYVDPNDGQQKTSIIASGATLVTLITELLARGCDTVTYFKNKAPIDCSQLKSLFIPSVNVMGANDYFMGTKGGICSPIYPDEAFGRMLELGKFSETVTNLFCELMSGCGAGKPCAPYNSFNAALVDYDASCPNILAFTYSFVGSDIHITALTWGNTPSVSQSVTVDYKLTSDGGYTNAVSGTTVNTDGTFQTPLVISLVAGASYDIRMNNDCTSPPDYFLDSFVVPGSVFSAIFKMYGDSDPNICLIGDQFTLYSSVPFGVGVTMYYDSNLTNPATGYNFIVGVEDLNIYNINTANGEVGADTGLDCSLVSGNYVQANSTIGICGLAPTTLYSATAIGNGVTLYTDSALTIPANGFDFVFDTATGFVYNMNSVTAEVGNPFMLCPM